MQFFVLAMLCSLWDLSCPNQGSNPSPLQWKRGVLTTGPPGKSLNGVLIFKLPTKVSEELDKSTLKIHKEEKKKSTSS